MVIIDTSKCDSCGYDSECGCSNPNMCEITEAINIALRNDQEIEIL